VIPAPGESARASASLARQLRNLVIFQHFVFGGWSSGKVIAEKARDQKKNSGIRRCALSQQIDRARKPGVITCIGSGSGACGPIPLPQLLRFSSSATCGSKILRMGSFLQILRFSTLELVVQKRRLVGADAFERKPLNQLLVRRYSSSLPGDHPSRTRKLRKCPGRKPSVRVHWTRRRAPWRFRERFCRGRG